MDEAKIKLKYIGTLPAKYWDRGWHKVQPNDIVEFCPKMARSKLKEPLWKKVPNPRVKKKGTD